GDRSQSAEICAEHLQSDRSGFHPGYATNLLLARSAFAPGVAGDAVALCSASSSEQKKKPGRISGLSGPREITSRQRFRVVRAMKPVAAPVPTSGLHSR